MTLCGKVGCLIGRPWLELSLVDLERSFDTFLVSHLLGACLDPIKYSQVM